MPRGSKAGYTDKQKRQAEHIAESYRKRGSSPKQAKKRAWKTVNKRTGGAKKSAGARRSRAKSRARS